MNDTSYRGGGRDATGSDAVAIQLADRRRRLLWRSFAIVGVMALLASIAGCLFMFRTQGLRADLAAMREEVGEELTMMSFGGANEAVARHLPQLIDTTVRWRRKFETKRERFRGMDAEIDQVQQMHRLELAARRWLSDLEAVSPMQRTECWRNHLKAAVEAEQKKWPNRTRRRTAADCIADSAKEIWYGAKHSGMWPIGVCQRTMELAKGGNAVTSLSAGKRLRYILFPYHLSSFTTLRFAAIVLTTVALGYLLCWLGLKSRFGWLSYAGLFYFLYLLNISFFIVWLEVAK
ncbi:MAG: hypothetical protein ACI4R9_04625 [Kiritimatiellia bacterium]